MEEYKLQDLIAMLGTLMEQRVRLQSDITNLGERGHELVANDAYCGHLSMVLDGVHIMCEKFNADSSLLTQIGKFRDDLEKPVADRHGIGLVARMDMLIQGIKDNLATRKFMYIPADEAAYWKNIKLFGEYFSLDFPEPAVFEALEAGNCFAAGRGTACVFHCMRVAEYGLRKLAKKLHVQLTHKGRTCPVEYADWDKVITGIKNKINATRQRSKGPKWEADLQFYSSAADHCEYMKDIWRNELAHTRRLYNKPETEAVVRRVRDFCLLFEPRAKNEDERLSKRVRQIQRLANRSAEGSAQRDQDQAGSGKTSEKAEEI